MAKKATTSSALLNRKFKLPPAPLVVGLFAVVLSVVIYASFASKPTSTTPVATTDSHILFASKEGSETNQIWKMDKNGGNKVRLTNDPSAQHEWARPSPDGKKILFMKASKDSSVNFATHSNRLWVMNTDGSNQQEIISLAKRDSYNWTGMAHAEWSPDSSKMVLVATIPEFKSRVVVIDSNGNSPEVISKEMKVEGSDSVVSDPSWSTTNQIMLIRGWECFGLCQKQDVFKIDYATREEVRITNDPGWNYDPYISPDGKTYLWLSFRNIYGCPCDMMRGSVAGPLNPTAVIADGGGNANGTFSADSTSIVFLKSVWFKQVLHRINLDGSGLTSLAPTSAGESGVASYIPVSSSGGSTNGGTSTSTPSPSGGGVNTPTSTSTPTPPVSKDTSWW
ncbi:PD40 domain-containing protein [bacterium]|nr:MAG: PD40 domain-containing protein [bacterium]